MKLFKILCGKLYINLEIKKEEFLIINLDLEEKNQSDIGIKDYGLYKNIMYVY